MDAIEKTSMVSLCNKFVSELSDGERQKAMIARLLAQDTDIMIMDEPTAFLDIASKYEILNLLRMLSQKSAKTIIFSTHDMHMAVSQSDKIWLILSDRLKEGAPEDLMIEGAFDHLFDSSSVLFNSEDGTFSFRGEEKGSIYIEGEGVHGHWTREAINRAGYRVSESKTNPYIRVTAENGNSWQIIAQNATYEFHSIYEMICSLRKEDIRST
jgi:iron complex transport system ATP-binding protein